jgi:hypothetical protein
MDAQSPDLRDEDIFKIARKEAVEISDLKREFMYGMMWLYTDDDNQTFSGWVKESHPNQNLKTLRVSPKMDKNKDFGSGGIKMDKKNR